MNRLLFSMAACGLLLCTAIADAQPPQQGRGRGNFGGGGFGGGPQGKLDLVNNEAVQKDMTLKEDQVAKVKELSDQVRDERRAQFQAGGNQGDFQNLSEEERRKRFAEMQTRFAENAKKLNDKYLPLLSEILTEEQENRLQQIVWQAGGAEALLDKDLAAKLKLSKEQQDKLASLNKEYTDKRSELFQGLGRGQGGQGGQDAFAKSRELRETRDKNMNDVLSAEQKAEYAKLKGKEFDVAQLRGRGFGGGQGGQPPGQGRPGGGQGRPGAEGRPGGTGRPQPNPQ